jgi:hypothetical protein
MSCDVENNNKEFWGRDRLICEMRIKISMEI